MSKPKNDKKTFFEKVQDLILKKLEQMDPKFVMEESLFLGIMLLLGAVSGRFKVWVMDGEIRGDDTFLTKQRFMLTNVLEALRDITTLTIPVGVIPGIGDIAPFKWATPFLEAWIDPLKAFEDRPPGAIAGQGQRYWKALNPLERVLMVLILPGLLKVAVRSTRQLIQLIK